MDVFGLIGRCALLVCLAATSCSTSSPGAHAKDEEPARADAAPVVQLEAPKATRDILTREGERFEIHVSDLPGAGYAWGACPSEDALVEFVGKVRPERAAPAGGHGTRSGRAAGGIGGRASRVMIFEALRPGTMDLVLVYGRGRPNTEACSGEVSASVDPGPGSRKTYRIVVEPREAAD